MQNVRLLSQFVSPHTGRIYGRAVTGLCIPMQKEVARAIKQSRAAGKAHDVLSCVRYMIQCPVSGTWCGVLCQSYGVVLSGTWCGVLCQSYGVVSCQAHGVVSCVNGVVSCQAHCVVSCISHIVLCPVRHMVWCIVSGVVSCQAQCVVSCVSRMLCPVRHMVWCIVSSACDSCVRHMCCKST